MISRLWQDLERAVRAVLPELPFLGVYRYRVVKKNSGDERWHLQAVESSRGLPDMLPISVRPGVAGAIADHALGAIVLVGFADGDRARPFIAHAAAYEDGNWTPTALTFDASGDVTIGESATAVLLGDGLGRVLREGDTLSLTGVASGGGATGVVATVTLGLGVPPTASKVKA